MPPVLTMKKVSYTLGNSFTLAVDELALEQGFIYALTGPNGSGKSTLLRLMALLITPQHGQVEFSGNGSSSPRQKRRHVTLVEQSPYLFKGSIADNLAYGLKLRGIESRERDRRIRETLADVGLKGFENRLAKELSGGEVQRVALARALVLQPELLLLDEPTANIDSNSLQGYEDLLGRLPGFGVTVVFSTHDPSQSRRLGDRILMIENGRLLSDAPALGRSKENV